MHGRWCWLKGEMCIYYLCFMISVSYICVVGTVLVEIVCVGMIRLRGGRVTVYP